MNNDCRQRILELGMTAPNVDNAQPFYFRWKDNQLLVFRDNERDRLCSRVRINPAGAIPA